MDPSRDSGRLPISAGDCELVFEVLETSSSPAIGVTVELLSGRESSETSTGADGMAVFDGIQDGTYTYRLKAEGMPELASAREVTLSPGEKKKLTLRIGAHDLSISGRVLDRSGKPVPGIVVVAREQLMEVGESRLVNARPEDFRTESGPDGTYEIGGLDAVDYVLSTESTEGFPSARKVYRAGTETADLVLEILRELRVQGRVVSREGMPLEGVRVTPTGFVALQALTDKAGRFSSTVAVGQEQGVLVLTATRDGFQEARASIDMEEVGDETQWPVEIVMEPLGAKAAVRGVVADTDGNPVTGEAVYLQSPSLNARYQAATDPEGRFELPEVQVGQDYRLLVYPKRQLKGAWLKDYSRSPVTVGEGGVELEVVLDRVGGGTVRGTMVDAKGAPIPRFSLWIRSLKALGSSTEVSGDDLGRFRAERVPEGDLLFETRSLPRLSLRGPHLAAEAEIELELVLDWGKETLGGSVVGEGGAPIPGANVSISWNSSKGGVQSSSFRNAVTDDAGKFLFSELGPGKHKVTARAPGFRQAQEDYDVGGQAQEVVLRLASDTPVRQPPR
jgi:protocatechuate 3,4-dioxygenase beta subunit